MAKKAADKLKANLKTIFKRVIHLTELGVSRFADLVDESQSEFGKRMQFTIEGNSVWFIGIPERGDMEKLIELCKLQGLHLNNVSWEQILLGSVKINC